MAELSECYNLGLAEHGEFCFVSHDPIFDSNLVTCRSNGPVSREAYVDVSFALWKF
ncbi:hypothetical protein L208DRAFT_8028 [Tricholoma matsutake]|nr:hypothetical protein L208DRAFT_8028 [Tricholoma matsutake 945]